MVHAEVPRRDAHGALLHAVAHQLRHLREYGSGGRAIIITDDETGDSQLSLSLIANNEGGGTLDFGAGAERLPGSVVSSRFFSNRRVFIVWITALESTSEMETDMIPLTFGGHTFAYHFARKVG